MFFRDIIGQQKIKSLLIQSIREGKVSHAQLFSGEEGYGGLPLAVAYAQYLFCEDRQEDEVCGVCPSCLKMQKLVHPDLHFVFPVVAGKSNQKPVSDDYIQKWRDAFITDPYISSAKWLTELGVENKQGMIYTHESTSILKKINLKSFESEFKVMIIWQPERMHQSCANKLLKIIEEPPAKTVFLLVSMEPSRLLPTILSRVQQIKIKPVDQSSLVDALRRKEGLSEEKVRIYSRLADGNYTRANEMIDQSGEWLENLNRFSQWMRLCYSRNILNLVEWIEDFAKEGREKNKSFLQYTLRILRENFLLNTFTENQNELILLTEEEINFSTRFSQFINEQNISPLAQQIEDAIKDISLNAYTKTVMLDTSLKIIPLIRN